MQCSFFFQAEDGIRDKLVTGVQTCALPISGGAQAKKFRVSTDGEYASREKCTLDDSARNCLQRVARFGTECGGALKSDKTKKCENETEPQAAAGHATKLQLLPVQVQAMPHEHQHDHYENQRHRHRFDPQHQSRGNLYVTPSNPSGYSRN